MFPVDRTPDVTNCRPPRQGLRPIVVTREIPGGAIARNSVRSHGAACVMLCARPSNWAPRTAPIVVNVLRAHTPTSSARCNLALSRATLAFTTLHIFIPAHSLRC